MKSVNSKIHNFIVVAILITCFIAGCGIYAFADEKDSDDTQIAPLNDTLVISSGKELTGAVEAAGGQMPDPVLAQRLFDCLSDPIVNDYFRDGSTILDGKIYVAGGDVINMMNQFGGNLSLYSFGTEAIEDITGLEYFRNVSYIDLTGNAIIDWTPLLTGKLDQFTSEWNSTSLAFGSSGFIDVDGTYKENALIIISNKPTGQCSIGVNQTVKIGYMEPYGYEYDYHNLFSPIDFILSSDSNNISIKTAISDVEGHTVPFDVNSLYADKGSANEDIAIDKEAYDDSNLATEYILKRIHSNGRYMVGVQGDTSRIIDVYSNNILYQSNIDSEQITFDVDVYSKTKLKSNDSVKTLHTVKLDKTAKGNKPIPGTKYALYYKDGEKYGEYETDKNGKIEVTGLSAGEYYWKETEAAEGYKLDDTPIPFTLEDGSVVIKGGTGSNVLKTQDSVIGWNYIRKYGCAVTDIEPVYSYNEDRIETQGVFCLAGPQMNALPEDRPQLEIDAPNEGDLKELTISYSEGNQYGNLIPNGEVRFIVGEGTDTNDIIYVDDIVEAKDKAEQKIYECIDYYMDVDISATFESATEIDATNEKGTPSFSINKTVGDKQQTTIEAKPGEKLDFYINVENTGEVNINNINVTDTPNGLTDSTFGELIGTKIETDKGNTVSISEGNDEGEIVVDALKPGDSVFLKYSATVDSQLKDGDDASNVVVAEGQAIDPDNQGVPIDVSQNPEGNHETNIDIVEELSGDESESTDSIKNPEDNNDSDDNSEADVDDEDTVKTGDYYAIELLVALLIISGLSILVITLKKEWRK